jgi:protein TonB
MELKKSNKANLENKRVIFIQIGMIVTLAVIFLAFEWKSYEKIEYNLEMEVPTIEEEIIPITRQENKPPPPPTPQTQELSIVEDDVEVEDDIEINAEIDQETEVEEYIPPPVEEEEEEVVEMEIFTVVEQMPEFPGGAGAMMKYLAENIQYPQMAREVGVQGTVFITFVVEPNGNITGVRVLRGIGSGCDEEAIRVVKSMPSWTPGKQRNRPVRVQFNLPVRFILQG